MPEMEMGESLNEMVYKCSKDNFKIKRIIPLALLTFFRYVST